MGQRGPSPRPVALSERLGNPGKRSKAELEGVPQPEPTGDLDPPEFLSSIAAQEWRRVAPKLRELGLLSDLDKPVLAVYCQSVADFIEADEFIKKNGPTYTTDKGNVIQRPEVGMKRAAAEQILKFSREFGCTPSARARMVVSLKPPDKKPTLEDILNG